jgi:hypothetical protein
MPVLIDDESKAFARSPFDIGRMGERYKTTNELFSFPSPTLETIEKNLFFLMRNSSYDKWEPKYRFRPDYLSADKYGTVTLWELLMYVNGVFSVEDFDSLGNVVVPSLQSVVEINKDNFPLKSTDELTEINW